MSTRLGRSFDDDSSVVSPEQFAREDLDNKAGGLTDCLDGKRHALVVTDIAELLSISERQVYKLVAAHRIPCFKIGGLIRFDPLAISAWLRQKMSPGYVVHLERQRPRTWGTVGRALSKRCEATLVDSGLNVAVPHAFEINHC